MAKQKLKIDDQDEAKTTQVPVTSDGKAVVPTVKLFGLFEETPGAWSLIEVETPIFETTSAISGMSKQRALDEVKLAIAREYVAKPAARGPRMDFSKVVSGVPLEDRRSSPPEEPA